jgi:glucose-1-phosphate adenylyltransferase
MQLRVLAFVLAGGKGTRLYPLTKERAKPAVPFGGKYRIVDFVLSNFINSGIHSIYVLLQFKSQSLLQHLRDGWQFAGPLKNQFIIPVPAQMRSPAETWYQGTADAAYQNLNLIEQADPHIVAIFGADHIYRMNIREMIEFHERKRAGVTVAAIPVDKRYAAEFGVIETEADGSIRGFHEKNADAPCLPGDSERVFASMGNYVFSTRLLLDVLHADAEDEQSTHDFGRDILPGLIGRVPMYAYDFQTNPIPGELPGKRAYWRDVGTIDAYWEAHMDLVSVDPLLNLYDSAWPIRTHQVQTPPAKFVFAQEKKGGRLGIALDSLVSHGCIVSGGRVQNSVLSNNVRINSFSEVRDSVLMENVDIGRHCRIRKAIIDKDVKVPPGTEIGFDPAEDRKRFYVSPSGIVVIGKGAEVKGQESATTEDEAY